MLIWGILEFIVSLGAFLLGLATVIATIISAVRTFVLPRGDNVWLTRTVFRNIRRVFEFYIVWRKAYSYEARDRIMAFYAPITLLLLPVVWLIYILLGFMFMFWAIGVRPWSVAFMESGSSMLTLGSVPLGSLSTSMLIFSEAVIGLGMLALLMAYLPTMYASFSRREAMVTMLEVRAGSPPSAIEMIIRVHSIRGLEYFNQMWTEWEIWFSELEESHTSLAPVIFFRSPHPGRSWITAAGAVLDGASLVLSCVNIPRDPQAQLCIRSGYIALRAIADLLRIKYNPDPCPDDPISISREEFDDAYDELAAAGVPMLPDRDQCWRDYAGWRVNYDTVLVELAALMMAPYAPWSSDRGKVIGNRNRTSVVSDS